MRSERSEGYIGVYCVADGTTLFFAASCSLLIAGSQTRRPVSQDQATQSAHAVHTAFRLESSLVESFRHSFHISAVKKKVDMYFNHITCRSANFIDLSRWQAKVLIRIKMLTAEKKTN